MLGAALILYFEAVPLVDLFLGPNQAPVAEVAAPLLRIVALAVVPLSLVMVLTGALRGSGDTRWPLLFTLIGFFGVRFPVAWLLAFHWRMGCQRGLVRDSGRSHGARGSLCCPFRATAAGRGLGYRR